MIREWAAATLLILGTLFILISAVGLLRFPDLFSRMQAVSKASSFGIVLMMAAVALHVGAWDAVAQAVLVVVLVFATTPVAAHMIARAAYLLDVPLYRKTSRDDLRGRYERTKGVLTGGAEDEQIDRPDVR